MSPEHMQAYAANCRRTLHYSVNGTLLAKRDHILHQMGRLRAKMLEVSHVKGVAEREVHSEASEALQRLAAAESLKQMRIQREVDELARHADAINSLAAEVDAATSAADSHSAEFLGRYRVSIARLATFLAHASCVKENNLNEPPFSFSRSVPLFPPSGKKKEKKTNSPARAPRAFRTLPRRLCTTPATAWRAARFQSPRRWTPRTSSARRGSTPRRPRQGHLSVRSLSFARSFAVLLPLS